MNKLFYGNEDTEINVGDKYMWCKVLAIDYVLKRVLVVNEVGYIELPSNCYGPKRLNWR